VAQLCGVWLLLVRALRRVALSGAAAMLAVGAVLAWLVGGPVMRRVYW
jgi:hypothetical protein